jgi:hypothetical protein
MALSLRTDAPPTGEDKPMTHRLLWDARVQDELNQAASHVPEGMTQAEREEWCICHNLILGWDLPQANDDCTCAFCLAMRYAKLKPEVPLHERA